MAFLRKWVEARFLARVFGFNIQDERRGMQPLFSYMLCAEITPLPALLKSLHIAPGCVCVCVTVCGMRSA